MPDEMLGMYNTKTMHPKAGANCAWVPSPTAATLHAIHYHQILVGDEQSTIINREKASLDAILDIPVHKNPSEISQEEIQSELDNNCQGILGMLLDGLIKVLAVLKFLILMMLGLWKIELHVEFLVNILQTGFIMVFALKSRL